MEAQNGLCCCSVGENSWPWKRPRQTAECYLRANSNRALMALVAFLSCSVVTAWCPPLHEFSCQAEWLGAWLQLHLPSSEGPQPHCGLDSVRIVRVGQCRWRQRRQCRRGRRVLPRHQPLHGVPQPVRVRPRQLFGIAQPYSNDPGGWLRFLGRSSFTRRCRRVVRASAR